MEINIPTIEQKYITLFETQQGYDDAQPDFIEVNWSAVKDTEHPEEVETAYYPSERQTHGYEPVDGDKVKPDAAHKSLYYTYDHILKTFFLEIIWGYYGWEWVDYKYTDPDTGETTTLKGGNLYKVKEITEVPSIPDGYRLEHINNFLNSQDKVTHVCWFDTSNIKSMNGAFQKPNSVGGSNLDLYIDVYNFPNVSQISNAFAKRNLFIIDNNILYFGKVKSLADAFVNCKINEDVPIIKIDAPRLTDASRCFAGVTLAGKSSLVLNINEILINSTLTKVDNFSGFFRGCVHSISPVEPITINLDLSESEVDSATVLDFSYFAHAAFTEKASTNSPEIPLTVNLNTYHHLNLDYAFSDRNSSASLNLNGKEALVDSAQYMFSKGKFSNIPYTSPINSHLNDYCIFRGAIFLQPVSYDFSPDNSLRLTSSQFINCKFYSAVTFSHISCMNEVVISYDDTGVTANEHFPYIIDDPNRTYADPRTQLCSIIYNWKNISDAQIYHVDYTRYRIISIGGSGIKSIAPQHIYSCYSKTFYESHIIFTKDVHLHWADRALDASGSSSNYFLDDYTITTPTIHWLRTVIAYAPINITGKLIEDVELHIEKSAKYPNDDTYPLCSLNLDAPNLVNLNIYENYQPGHSNVWNLTRFPNLNISTLVATLNKAVYKSTYYDKVPLRLTKAQYDTINALDSTCIEHCLSVFSYIDSDN